MSIEKVKAYFNQFGMADKIQEFDVSSATVELAAQALHCEPCRIAKPCRLMWIIRQFLSLLPGMRRWIIRSIKLIFQLKPRC